MKRKAAADTGRYRHDQQSPRHRPGDQVPGAPAAAICKRPGCGNILPAQDRGRTRQFCNDQCARRYHNDARVPVPAAAPADNQDPLAALDTVLRQAAVLTRAARDQAASLDPARVRAQIAETEAARRRAEAAAVTAEARAAEATAETQALAEALDTARDDARAARAEATAARQQAQDAAAALEQARHEAAGQITDAHAEAAAQVSAAQAEAARYARERDDAAEAARRADAEILRARQAEADARAETDRVRADAARERGTLREQHQAQLDAVDALTAAERARAERAEQLLDTERADRRHLTSALAPASGNGNGNGNGNGKLSAGRGRQGRPAVTGTALTPAVPVPPPIPDDLDAVLRRMRFPYLRKAAPDVLATARAQRWDPADVVRILLEEEIRGRDDAGRRIRRKAAGLPAGKTFASWREDRLLHPAARPARPDDPGMGHPRGESLLSPAPPGPGNRTSPRRSRTRPSTPGCGSPGSPSNH